MCYGFFIWNSFGMILAFAFKPHFVWMGVTTFTSHSLSKMKRDVNEKTTKKLKKLETSLFFTSRIEKRPN